jgi:hypothetical protein
MLEKAPVSVRLIFHWRQASFPKWQNATGIGGGKDGGVFLFPALS